MPIFHVTTSTTEDRATTDTCEPENKKVKSGFSIKVNGPGFQKDKCKAFKKTRRSASAFLLLSAIPCAILSMSEVKMLSQIEEITDAAVAGKAEEATLAFHSAIPWIILAAMFFVLCSFIHAAYVRMCTEKLKIELLEGFRSMFPRDFLRHEVSEYIAGMSGLVYQAEDYYFDARYNIMRGMIEFSAGIVLAVIVEWKLLLLSLIIIAILFVAIQLVVVKHQSILSDFIEERANYTSRIRELLESYLLIWQNNLQEKMIERFDKSAELLQERRVKQDKLLFRVGIFTSLFASAVLFSFVLYAFIQVRAGNFTVGKLLFLLTALLFVLQPGIGILTSMPSLESGRKALVKLEKLMSGKSENGDYTFSGLKHEIVVNGVSALYDESAALENVNVKLQAGKKYLIVGPSGGGKTTFLKLLRGYFEQANDGIMIDGIPLSRIDMESWIQHTSFLSQSIFMLHDTIRNNITLMETCSDEDLRHIIRIAGLEKMINQLENGVDTVVEEGGKNLSGGEKARIAIARAIFFQAEIFLLDEPFANLDDETAIAIEKEIIKLPNTLVINVSHVTFNETVNSYDEIIRVADGKVEYYTKEI